MVSTFRCGLRREEEWGKKWRLGRWERVRQRGSERRKETKKTGNQLRKALRKTREAKSREKGRERERERLQRVRENGPCESVSHA